MKYQRILPVISNKARKKHATFFLKYELSNDKKSWVSVWLRVDIIIKGHPMTVLLEQKIIEKLLYFGVSRQFYSEN